MREDAVPAVVNVSFTINSSVVSRLLVKELVRIGAVATAVVNNVIDGVSNFSVVIISVASLGTLRLVVNVDIGSVIFLVTMVTGCTDVELACIDDNSLIIILRLVVTVDTAVDIGSVIVLVTMVTGCTDVELACIDDNSLMIILRLVVTVDIAVDIVLVTMVTGCTDAELACIDNNSDDGSSTERKWKFIVCH